MDSPRRASPGGGKGDGLVEVEVRFVAAAAAVTVVPPAVLLAVVAVEGRRQAVEQPAQTPARCAGGTAIAFRAIAFEEFEEIHVEPPLRSWRTTPGRIHQDG